MRILLINPWITDFAAYDFWARPLGLLSVGALLRERGHEIHLIDCLDRFNHPSCLGQPRKYSTGKFHREPMEKPAVLTHVPRRYGRYGMPLGLFREHLRAAPRPDVILVTCVMTYWYPGADMAVAEAREIHPGVPVVLGGVYPVLCPEHASANSRADRVVTSSSIAAIIAAVEEAGGEVPAIPAEDIPFPQWPQPCWELYPSLPSALVMTSRGCPMHCTVCASRILFDGFERRVPDNAAAEILALAARGTEDVAFADDALLLNADTYAIPLFERLAEAGAPVRLHTPNGLHIRAISPELATAMHHAGMKTVRLSLETAAAGRAGDFSHKTGRDDFLRAVAALRGSGFTAGDMGAYVLAGLPGQEEGEVVDTVRFSLDVGVPVMPALFSPVPGTVEFQRALEAGMLTADADPLLHNNTLRTLDFWKGGPDAYHAFRRAVTQANAALREGRGDAVAVFTSLHRRNSAAK